MNILMVVALLLLSGIILIPWLVRRAYRIPGRRNGPAVTPADLELPYRSCLIPSANGKKLAAWWVGPDKPDTRLPLVLVMHGWGGSTEQMLPFASLLHAAGYQVLLVNARNHGNSDTDNYSSMPRFAEDIEHSLAWAKAQGHVDLGRIFLLGHSVGAAACLLVASRRDDLAGIVSIASFCHPAELMGRQMRSHHIPYIPVGWLVLRYVERVIGFSLDAIAPCHTIHDIHVPVLLVHGKRDRTIPYRDAEQIYQNRSGDQVQLVLLENAGHNSIGAITRHGQLLIDFMARCHDAPGEKST